MINATEPLGQLQQFAAELQHSYPDDCPIPRAPSWWLGTLPHATAALCQCLASIDDAIALPVHEVQVSRRGGQVVTLNLRRDQMRVALGNAYATIAAITAATHHDIAHLHKQGQQWACNDFKNLRMNLAASCRGLMGEGYTPAGVSDFHHWVAKTLGSIDKVRSDENLDLLEVLQGQLGESV